MAAQLKQFLDTAGGLWQQGVMAGTPVTSFTSSINVHGGAESTLLSLNNVFYHWGSLIVSPGYTDPAVVVDATNRLTGPPADPTSTVPPFHQLRTWRQAVPEARPARAFRTVGWEVMANGARYAPPPTLPFSAPADDRGTVESLVHATGMVPWWIGDDDLAADTVDGPRTGGP